MTGGGGWSGIFHFPYRINAQEQLHEHEAVGVGFRYRVHSPFLLSRQASPVTNDVPPNLWPDFKWHDSVPETLRGVPVAPVEMRYSSESGPAIWYDGLRVDIWGPGAQERISPFVLSFMRWLRHLSGQPWINDVDQHSRSTLKRIFPIDNLGAATDQVSPLSEMVTVQFRFVTDAMWQRASELAASGREVPVYSNLFFDAMNAAATHDHARAVMNLAMALESCRDQNFSRLHPATFVKDRGPQLKAPFDHTDLLKHVSENAQEVFGRDFSREHADHWPHFRNLYVARHHVAHGRGAVFQTDKGLKLVDENSYGAMQSAAAIALRWMEALPGTVAAESSKPEEKKRRKINGEMDT
jgi:hypothetical protein